MFERGLRPWLAAILSFAAVVACGEKEHPNLIADPTGKPVVPPRSSRPTGTSSHAPAASANGDAAAASASGSGAAGDAAAPTASSDAQVPVAGNCGELICRGHGQCLEKDGSASCVCDTGYVPEGQDADFECVVDRTCKRLHMLQETGCIQLVNGAPAVALFFAVDYCAGTAVLPEDLGDDLSQAFRILEGGNDLSDESVATVIQRDVESYVTIALDISKSVTGGGDDPDKQARLTAITSQMRDFVADLKGPAGAPPVSVSILVFGRFVSEYVPFTTDLDKVDAALAALQEQPESVVATVSAQGTALFDATKVGIQTVERFQRLRSVVTDGGVLSSGTLVVVTDGEDTVGTKLDPLQNQISKTLVNVISIGISSDINDTSLSAIGRDGSFLAPTEADWVTSFAEISERVRQYPERAYLLAYCTSLTTGTPNVSVSLSDEEPEMVASCTFNADSFSKDPVVASSCTLDFFKDYCDSRECGTIFACGACADSECCSGGVCNKPGNADDCRDQNALCAVGGKTCYKEDNSTVFACTDAPGPGEECGAQATCAPHSFCGVADAQGTRLCEAVVLENGDVCGKMGDINGNRCPEGNCAIESATIDRYICKPQARANEPCSGSTASAECEPGTYCKAGVCVERGVFVNCNTDPECGSGTCDKVAHVCVSQQACYFDWASILEP